MTSNHDEPCAIAITGVSAWSCFGRGVGPLLEALAGGRRGWGKVEGLPELADPWFPTDCAMQAPPAAEITSGLDGQTRPVNPRDWPLSLAVETAGDAWLAAGLEGSTGVGPGALLDRRRVAVLNGSSHGSNHALLEYLAGKLAGQPEHRLLMDSASWVARQIARRLDARGPNLTINTACSSSLNALGQAARLLRAGRIDCALAGGNDAFSLLSFAGFSSLRAVDPQGCRPFDLDRAGMSLGDGAAYCVLERAADARARGAPILALLTGAASAGEGFHPTAPDPTGRGALEVMTRALAQDGRPQDLAFVAAHGTGTVANDGAEAAAIQEAVRRFAIPGPVRVTSIKSQIGHTLGSAGALQVVATVACMQRRLVPGTIGLQRVLPHQPPLEFPSAPLAADIPLALCNSFGFAGSVAAVTLRPAPAGAPSERRAAA